MKPADSAYRTRDGVLKLLGYRSYLHYLGSPAWRKIARTVWATRGSTCVLCPKEAAELHHLSYVPAVLVGAWTDPIVPLCKTCHNRVEFGVGPKGRRRKRSFPEAVAAFKVLHDARVEALRGGSPPPPSGGKPCRRKRSSPD